MVPTLLQLVPYLPRKLDGRHMITFFDTSVHGWSLSTLYKRCSKLNSPVLLVVLDQKSNVFLVCPLLLVLSFP